MKFRILALAALALIIDSCSPKVVAMPPSDPVVPQMPNLHDNPLPETAAAKIEAGKSLYENNCGKCHKLFSPSDRTREQWAPILVRMQKKAHLDDPTMALINDYVVSNTN